MSAAPQHPPFRAEHLGSLLRPQKLLDVRHAVAEKKEDKSALPSVEDSSIKDIVKTQEECGFHAPSDGEYRRHMFWGTFFPSLNGMKEVYGPDPNIFRPYAPDIAAFLEEKHIPGETVICDGKISHSGKSSYIDQFEYMKTLVPQSQWGNIKLTLAAPNWYHFRYKEGLAYPKEVYKNDDEYYADIAEAYRQELKILYDAGLRNAQVDDPNLACKFPSFHLLFFFRRSKQGAKLTCRNRLLLGENARGLGRRQREQPDRGRAIRRLHHLLQRLLPAALRHASRHPPVPWKLRQQSSLLRGRLRSHRHQTLPEPRC